MDANVSEKLSSDLFELISHFRNTVEGVLACNNNTNVFWNVFGGLSRTKKAVFNVLIDGLRPVYSNDCHPEKMAIENLCQAVFSNVSEEFTCSESEDADDILLLWIEHHLLDHSLYDCIQNDFVDSPQILKHYKEFAFIKNEVLLAAFLSCLNALRNNSMDQLSTTNLQLMNRSEFVIKLTLWVSTKMIEEYKIEDQPLNANQNKCNTCENDSNLCDCSLTFHSRTSTMTSQRSFNQDMLIKSALSAALDTSAESKGWYLDVDGRNLSRNTLHEEMRFNNSTVKNTLQQQHSDSLSLRSHQNEDALSVESLSLPRSSASVKRPTGHHRSKSDQLWSINLEAQETTASSSLPNEMRAPDETDCRYYRDEDGQLFPKPYKGQSLISYLESRSYDTGAQLDKENAHFSICEALITAIEQMRCNSVTSDVDSEGDEEIISLKRQISERKRMLEKQKSTFYTPFSSRSDGTKSSSFKTSSTFSSSSSVKSSTADDSHVSDATLHPNHLRRRSVSGSWENLTLHVNNKNHVSDVPSIGEAEQVEIIQDDESLPDDFSAEAVAKCLLKKFQGHVIPAASELKWMVSEEDVPQQLLPMPNALPMAPDAYLTQNDYSLEAGLRKISIPMLIRGNLEWAPPRPQIIFVPHPFVKRKVMLQRQNYRCAGCGLKVLPSLSRCFRFCEYLGKYFCSSCHQNKLSLIPAKILSKWDFKKYPVSDFAKDFLKKIHKDPLFNVMDIVPNLYQNVRLLALTKNWRMQLHYLKKFLQTCRLAKSEQTEISKLPPHLCNEPHLFSIEDFVQTKNGDLQTTLKALVINATKHVKVECQLCSARGFVCEFCRDGNDILYPFELQKVILCLDCKTCYHRSCFVQGKCARCERISARKKLLEESLPDMET